MGCIQLYKSSCIQKQLSAWAFGEGDLILIRHFWQLYAFLLLDHQKGRTTCVCFRNLCSTPSSVIQAREEMHLLVKQAQSLIIEHYINPFPIFPLLIHLQNMISAYLLQFLAALLPLWLSAKPHPHRVPRPGRSLNISKENGTLLPVHLSPQQLSCQLKLPSTCTSSIWEGRHRCVRNQGS